MIRLKAEEELEIKKLCRYSKLLTLTLTVLTLLFLLLCVVAYKYNRVVSCFSSVAFIISLIYTIRVKRVHNYHKKELYVFKNTSYRESNREYAEEF